MKLKEKWKKKYIGDRSFYRRYLLLAVPMILQNAITNLVSFLDNIMVGQLGTEQMSGVAIVNQLIFVYNLAIFGAVSAASIFGAQYFGQGNHKGHMHSFRFKLYAALLVTILTIALFVTKGCGSDFIVFDGCCRKRCDGACFAVWTEVSGDYDDWSDSVCGQSGVRDEYQRDRSDVCSDDREFCCGRKQCTVGLSVDLWHRSDSETWCGRSSNRYCDGTLY